MFNLTSPLTGAAVTGLTSPTYTVNQTSGPTQKAKQWYVSALGGTQTGVDTHTVAKPFTIAFIPPAKVKAIPAANPVTGIVKTGAENMYRLVTRKGGQPAANQSPQTALISTMFRIPAGIETYEPEELKAMASAHIGALTQQINGIIDTLISGEA